MNNHHRKLSLKKLLLILCFFGITNFSYAQSSIIDSVKVVGNNHVALSTLIKVLPFKVGDLFDSHEVSSSVDMLYEYGFFDDIKVLYQFNSEGNAEIVYQVKEKPWIESVIIKGNKDLASATIRNKITNSASKFYNPFFNDKDTETILNMYIASGFIGTKVEISTEPVDKEQGSVNVVINIYEGEKLTIEKIFVHGTQILSPNFLIDSFEKLKEPSIFGILRYSFIPEMLPYEENRMIMAAKQKGFLDFQILHKELVLNLSSQSFTSNLERVLRKYDHSQNIQKLINEVNEIFLSSDKNTRLEPFINEIREELKTRSDYEKNLNDINVELKSLEIQGNSLINAKEIITKSLPDTVSLKIQMTHGKQSFYNIHFTVKEGAQYVFSHLEILGSPRIDSNYLKKTFLVADPGDIYNVQNINQFKSLVEQYYRDRGYFGIVIQDTPLKDDKLFTMGHRIIIQEGEKMHIEKMYIKNNQKIKSYVIDRELRIKEGSIFNQSDIVLSQRLLQRTGYFQDINVIPSPGSDENLLDLTWLVQEQKTGSFRFGGGYGTETGFSVYGSISETSFLGEGISTSLNGQWGQYQRSLQFAISSQYIGYLPIGWSVSTGYVWYRENASPRYDRNHDGVWDKIILKNGVYHFIQKGDPEFYEYYDENRTGSFNVDGAASGDEVNFTPSTYDSTYSYDRYFDRQMIYAEVGAGYSFADFWNIQLSNGISFSRYSNPTNIELDNIYEDKYYTLKNDILSGDFIYASYLRLGLQYNSTNSPLTPTQGLKTSFNTDFYGIEGGSSKFIRLTYKLSGYVPIVASKKYDFDLVWASGLSVAGNVPLFNTEFSIHYENLLSFNTMEEIRGWSQYIGNAEFLGLGKISFGTEFRASIPFTNKMLWLVGYFDGGNISENPLTLPTDFTSYFYSAGLGVRIDLASFPLRFYLAQRLAWDQDKHFFKTVGSLTFEFAVTSSF